MTTVFRSVAALAAALALGACATEGVYRPQTAAAAAGYSEQRLDETHWRVEFVGDESASHEAVESHLLRRAAELTVASGYDWFAPVNRSAGVDSEIVVEAQRPRVETESPVWRPMWRHRSRTHWSDWMVRGPAPAPASAAAEADPPPGRTIDRYAAREDIAMGRGPAPAGAFDAREVLALLGAR